MSRRRCEVHPDEPILAGSCCACDTAAVFRAAAALLAERVAAGRAGEDVAKVLPLRPGADGGPS